LRTDPAATRRVLGRPDKEYFLQDRLASNDRLQQTLGGRRVLVIGGAGSIGSATVREIAAFAPAALHVVDTDENALAELVRDLRSQRAGLGVPDFRALPIDFGSPLMRRLLLEERAYHVVLNFAALKHVRSEKDVCSLLQLLETNVVRVARLLCWLREPGAAARFFTVSTDKAANPVSLMGASKRIMEDVAFSRGVEGPAVCSARFANVAFSNGSLLDSFVNRLAKRQPVSVPRDTRRFFVTLEEAGRLCLLAAAASEPGHIVVPGAGFRAVDHRLEDVAARFLREHGLEPRIYDDEEAARQGVLDDHAAGRYPLLLTRRDTSGEKAYEEFVGEGEETLPLGFRELEGVRHRPSATPECLASFVSEIERLVGDPHRAVRKSDLVDAMRRVVPRLAHVDTGRTLDERM
jgi:FlaA1/EpsC-like NDP-sugar epimerase